MATPIWSTTTVLSASQGFLVVLIGAVLVVTSHCLVIDQVYNQCNQPISSRLNLECIGFPKTDCLSRRACDMIAMLQVVPSLTGNHFNDELNITLIGTHLLEASKHEMSLVLDAAFNPTYRPGEGTYYNCSWSRADNSVEVSVRNPGQLVESIGVGIIEEDLLICKWYIGRTGRSADAWPTDHFKRKIDLFTKKIEFVLYKDGTQTGIVDNRLPIYKSRYLYTDCDHQDVKYCLGSPYCVDTYFECHEVLTVTQSKTNPDNLDFNLYTFDSVGNGTFYEVTLISLEEHYPSLQVVCNKHSVSSFSLVSDGSQEPINNLLISPKVSIDNEFDGLRCNWSLPKSFSLSGYNYNIRNTKYTIKLRHSSNIYFDKEPLALPGFHIDDALYNECNVNGLNKRPGRECFGLDPKEPSKNCLTSKECKVFAIFEVNGDLSWSPFVEPKMTLDLYAASTGSKSNSSDDKTIPWSNVNVSLSLAPGSDLTQSTLYSCLYENNESKFTYIQKPDNQRMSVSGRVTREHNWIHCQWTWWPNGTWWPTNDQNIVVNLVNRRPSMQLSINDNRKLLPYTSVTLPIYRVRYIYSQCNGPEARCLGSEPDCVSLMNCSALIHMREHNGREAIDVQVLLMEDFDKLEMVYSDESDNSIKIECYSVNSSSTGAARFAEWSKSKSSQIYKPIDNHFIKYVESKTFPMGFSRCNWLQEKYFLLDEFIVNSEHNRYNVKLSVTNEKGSASRWSWNSVGFVGYKVDNVVKPEAPSSGYLTAHSGLILFISSLVTVNINYFLFTNRFYQ